MLCTRFFQLPEQEIRVPDCKGYTEISSDIVIDETTGTMSVSGNPPTSSSYYRTGAQISPGDTTTIYAAAKTNNVDSTTEIFYLYNWFILGRLYMWGRKFVVADQFWNFGSASGDKISETGGYRNFVRICAIVSGESIVGRFSTNKVGGYVDFLNCTSLQKTSGSYAFRFESVVNYCAFATIYLKNSYVMQGSKLLWRWK